MSTCRSCGAPIWWVLFRDSRKANPLNPTPDPKGTIGIVQGQKHHDGSPLAIVVKNDVDANAVGADRYTSHFSDCPNAGQHRRARS